MQSNSTSVNGALNFSHNPLQNLKDAIDRATEIVRSGSQYEVDSVPYFENCCNSEINTNNTHKYETALEDLYGTKRDDNNQQISVIEKSSGMSFLDDYVTAESSIEMEGKAIRDYVNYKPHDITRTNNHICETIAEVDSNGSQISVQNQQLEDLRKPNRDERAYINGAPAPQQINIAAFKTVPLESVDLNNVLLRSSNIARCEACNSHDSNDLRRRSLPACLNNLKITQNPGLRKVYAYKSVSTQITLNLMHMSLYD